VRVYLNDCPRSDAQSIDQERAASFSKMVTSTWDHLARTRSRDPGHFSLPMVGDILVNLRTDYSMEKDPEYTGTVDTSTALSKEAIL